MKKWLYILISSIIFLITLILSLTLGVFNFDKIYKIIIFVVFLFSIISFIISSIFFFIYKYRQETNVANERLKYWNTLSFRIDEVGEDIFEKIPFSVLVLNENKDIIWVNNNAKTVFKNLTLNQNIDEFNTDITLNIKNNISKFTIKSNNEYFDCIYKKEANVLYLFNSTEKEEIKIKFKENMPVVGLINIEYLGQGYKMKEETKVLFLTEISDWVLSYNGLFKKYGDDKYIITCYRKDLEKMIKNNFSILDKIDEVSKKTDLKASLSIGISSWDKPYSELVNLCQSAVELAQNRGGDQVVVNIENQEIKYYGAKQDAKLQYSRVKTKIVAEELKEKITKSSNVVIMGHIHSDTDAFGSQLLTLLLSSPLKNSYLVYDFEQLDLTVKKISNDLLKKEPYLKKYFKTSQEILKLMDDETLLILLDTQSPQRASSKQIFDKAKNVIVIDHHRAADVFDDSVSTYIEPTASSSVELMVELSNFFEKVKITEFEASVILAGIVVDTTNFSDRTDSKTFFAAARLKELGADLSQIKLWLRNDFERILFINKALASTNLYKNNFGIVTINEKVEDTVVLAQIADELLNIDDIEASFAIGYLNEEKTKVGVSTRSTTSNVNVQIIMEQIGGGGHFNKAAASLKDTTVELVEKEIKNILDLEYDKEAEKVKVILIQDLKNKGKKGDIIEVTNGFGNHLIASKQAKVANEENLNELKLENEKKALQEQEMIRMMKELKLEIDQKQIVMQIRVGQEGKMFGSITTKHVAEEFYKQTKILVDRKNLELASEINSPGTYTCKVKLYKDIVASFNINIIKQEQ